MLTRSHSRDSNLIFLFSVFCFLAFAFPILTGGRGGRGGGNSGRSQQQQQQENGVAAPAAATEVA